MNSANIVNSSLSAKYFVHFYAVFNEIEQGDMSEHAALAEKLVA